MTLKIHETRAKVFVYGRCVSSDSKMSVAVELREEGVGRFYESGSRLRVFEWLKRKFDRTEW